MGARPELVAELRFDIPAMYVFHKEQTKDVAVDLLRFEAGAAPPGTVVECPYFESAEEKQAAKDRCVFRSETDLCKRLPDGSRLRWLTFVAKRADRMTLSQQRRASSGRGRGGGRGRGRGDGGKVKGAHGNRKR